MKLNQEEIWEVRDFLNGLFTDLYIADEALIKLHKAIGKAQRQLDDYEIALQK